MNLEAFQKIAASNLWGNLLPEIYLVALCLLLLVFEMVFRRQDLLLLFRVALWGQVLLLVLMGLSYFGGFPSGREELFGGLLVQTPLTETMRLFFLFGSLLVSYLGTRFLRARNLARTEFFAITLLVTAALMLLVQSNQFVLLFVALETVTVGFYVLVAYARTSGYSLEAGLKYLIMGALSSGLLLFGIVLLYGVAGSPDLAGAVGDPLHFPSLAQFIAAHPDNTLVLAGSLLVLSGIAFKVGAVPFQIWIPDVYQGAPTPVSAFLAVSSKAAGIIVLLTLVTGPFAALSGWTIPLISTVAVLTILYGNLTALPQRNVKRIMGLSGIAHAGYLLMGVVAAMTVDWAVGAIVFYLFTYLLASFGVFGVMALLSEGQDADQELDHYEDLAKRQPLLAAALTVGLASLAGIPPLGGFIGKLVLFIAAFQAGLYTLLAFSVVGVVLSIYYYFGWVREAVFRVWRSAEGAGSATPALPEPRSLTGLDRTALVGLSVLTLILGVAPFVLTWFLQL